MKNFYLPSKFHIKKQEIKLENNENERYGKEIEMKCIKIFNY